MTQRRLDLAVLEPYELQTQLRKFKMLQRMAREMGAHLDILSQWQMHIDDIEAELSMRADEDGVAPF